MNKLLDLPVIKQVIAFLKAIKPPGFNGFSLFDLFQMYIIGIVEGTLTSRAGSISFSFFMALFPFLLFVLNLIPFISNIFHIENFDQHFLEYIEMILPKESQSFFVTVFEDILNKPRGGLLSSVFLLSIFLTANGVSAIFAGFEVSYHVALARNFIKQYLYALGVSILLAFLLLMAVILFIYFQIYIPKDMTFLFGYGQFVIFGFLTYTSVSVLYYFGTIEGRKMRFFSPGALMTTLLFFLMTYLYGIYIDNFSNYNQLYGSIGALLIFLLYIWMNSNTLLLGFELNATLNRFKREPKALS